MPSQNISWFSQVDKDDSEFIGEHGAKLGEFTKSGILIPDGFIVTSNAFNNFIDKNNLRLKAKHLLTTVNFNDPNSLRQVSSLIKKYFEDSDLSSDFKIDLYNAYKKLSGTFNMPNVRIIASPRSNSNFHRLQNKFEDVWGESSLINAIKDLWAQNFTELNIVHNHHEPDYVKSLVVQKIVDPDKSGKIFTIDFKNKDKNKMIIKASLGLFDDKNLNFATFPDYLEIDKNTHEILLQESYPQLKMSRKINSVKKLIDVPKSLRNKQKLLSNEIEELIKNAKLVEKFMYFPQEIDWGIEKNKIYFINSRPITILS